MRVSTSPGRRWRGSFFGYFGVRTVCAGLASRVPSRHAKRNRLRTADKVRPWLRLPNPCRVRAARNERTARGSTSSGRIAAGNLTTPHAVRDFVRGYEEAGCDHLVLFPTVSDPSQLERLAEVLG